MKEDRHPLVQMSSSMRVGVRFCPMQYINNATLQKAIEGCRLKVHKSTTVRDSRQLRLSLRAGPARPTSLKTVPARPKIRPGQEDVKSRLRWPRMQHEPNMPARPTTLNEVQNSFANLALSNNRITSFTIWHITYLTLINTYQSPTTTARAESGGMGFLGREQPAPPH